MRVVSSSIIRIEAITALSNAIAPHPLAIPRSNPSIGVPAIPLLLFPISIVSETMSDVPLVAIVMSREVR